MLHSEASIAAAYVQSDNGGVWHVGSGTEADKAWDGSATTFYDAKLATGAWTAADLGQQYVIGRIQYIPRADWAGRMVGGKFEAANTLQGKWDLA